MGALAFPDPWVVVLLCLAALAAGWVDAVSGGGGLLQLPALLIALPDSPPVEALATNKASSILGTVAAATTYLRRAQPDVRTALPMAVAAFAGAAGGALVASHVPTAAFRPVIVVLLAAVWLWTLLSPAMGMQQSLRWHGHRRHYVVATAAGLAIGFYDGMLGPGTGSFLLIVLVAGLGYSFPQRLGYGEDRQPRNQPRRAHRVRDHRLGALGARPADGRVQRARRDHRRAHGDQAR